MNSEETQALWRQGKGAWEAWTNSVAQKRAALVSDKKWSVDWFGEGQNEETRAWIDEATANFAGVVFEECADFSGMLFPGPVEFDEARLARGGNFSGARFAGNASFERTQFEGDTHFTGTAFHGFTVFDNAQFARASFAKANFTKETRDLPELAARFRRVRFTGLADFSGARFVGEAAFPKIVCAGGASFAGAEFCGEAAFMGAQFHDAAEFTKARFSGASADFGQTQFHGPARFADVHFGGSWGDLVTSGGCAVNFDDAQFHTEATFQGAWFVGETKFKTARFGDAVTFEGAGFVMPVCFATANFAADVSFKAAQFARETSFEDVRFDRDAEFSGSDFRGAAMFDHARFSGAARFGGARFGGAASFRFVTAAGVFDVAALQCAVELNFAGADFTTPPALDGIARAKPKLGSGFRFWPRRERGEERPLMIRWRRFARKTGSPRPDDLPCDAELEPDRLAPPSLDALSETGAQASQVTSKMRVAREVETLTPVPRRPEPQAPASIVETAVEALPVPMGTHIGAPSANHHASPPQPQQCVCRRRRSLATPFLAWVASVIGFALFFLYLRPRGAQVLASQSAMPDWLAQLWGSASSAPSGVGGCIHGASNAVGEAVYLSLSNALVVAANNVALPRACGCLYGMDGGLPVIPLTVSYAGLAQVVLSAGLMLLFILALRDRLRDS